MGLNENQELSSDKGIESLEEGEKRTIKKGDIEFEVWREGDEIHARSCHKDAKAPEGEIGPSGWSDTGVIGNVQDENLEAAFDNFVSDETADWDAWKADRERHANNAKDDINDALSEI